MKTFDPPPYQQPMTEGGVISPWWKGWYLKVSSWFGSGQLPNSITPGASPYAYQNPTSWDQNVVVKGGTVTKIEYSRDDSTYYDVGVTAGMFVVFPGDFLRVTYAVAPTMTAITR